MSKIGRQPIIIPDGVMVEITNERITVTGPKGKTLRTLPKDIRVIKEKGALSVESKNFPLWGTWRAHLANMVKGVTSGFEKILELRGVGYKVSLQGSILTFQIGFSHPVTVNVPEGLSCEVKENKISIKGVDKERVGQFAASLRSLRPPDAYKGKGIRYENEVVKIKPGKKAGVGIGAQ